MKKETKRIALTASLVGIMAATIECAKLALAALPNVEVVTLLIAVYSYVFGSAGILAAVVFVMIEPLIWSFGPWVISYFLYWPLVGAVFMILGKLGAKRRLTLTLTAGLLTLFFGVLSSLVDIGLFSGNFDRFFYRFAIYYARGVWFYLAQLLTNLVVFPTLFPHVASLLSKIKHRLSL